jgi:hypothetical protein
MTLDNMVKMNALNAGNMPSHYIALYELCRIDVIRFLTPKIYKRQA